MKSVLAASYRKQIPEIAERLKREPSIREMYVEGIYDRDFYRAALKSLGINDVQVYPIDMVDVPYDLLQKIGLTSGERQRVQAAASHFFEKKDVTHQILFLIDADLDYLLDIPDPHPPLERTSGTSTEIIMWNKSVLERFFSIALGRQDAAEKAGEVMPFIEAMVEQLCVFRAAISGKSWSLPEMNAFFSRKKDFKMDSFLQQVASKNAAHREIQESIIPIMDEIRVRAERLDIGKRLHGHDLLAALSTKLQLSGFNNKCLEDASELNRLMMASLEWAMVLGDETLIKLKNKFPPPNRNVRGVFAAHGV
ncbi:DUF4435 domain-containing protein [Burkholderia pyrrocinia]|uniref:DUF4435 domain-containing protein n=1 Tax=Burkholderia pyrrocinia TaxID=60550 RepID=UPI001BCE68C5|nr:DUF4435 domain-containing protein [Burkholderia pyrrocinia]QVN22489.1 hypothetical protein JYG32_24410 [Burkholderia pyrrocinia]